MCSITCNTEDCNKENNLKKPTHICIHTHTNTHKRQTNERSSCQRPLDHRKSKVIPEKKNISFCFPDYAKAFVQKTTNCGKVLRDGNTRPSYQPPEKLV